MPPTCKGTKKDGTPCESKAVMANGYCYAHQGQAGDQSPPEPIDVSGPWTRERLEAAIEAHGGPKGLRLDGADLSGLELWGIDLRGAILKNCNLSGAILDNARLTGAHLHHVILEGAYLNEAYLDDTQGWYVNLHGAELWQADLSGADLQYADLTDAFLRDATLPGAKLYHAKLQRATLGGANLQETKLIGANLRGANLFDADLRAASLAKADLQDARLERADLSSANLRYADLRGVVLLDVAKDSLLDIKLYRARLDRTLLRKDQLGPAIADELEGEYQRACDIYLALKQNFESLGDYDEAAWAYIKERHMERKGSAPHHARRFFGEEQLGDSEDTKLPANHPRVWWFYLRHTAKYINDTLQWWICGYGERPWHTVLTMTVVFAFFVAFYWVTWCVGRVEVALDGSTTLVPTRDLLDVIVFSLGAFTTMDASRLAPRAPIVEVLMGIEALLGIGLTGLLGFVIGNRIRRS